MGVTALLLASAIHAEVTCLEIEQTVQYTSASSTPTLSPTAKPTSTKPTNEYLNSNSSKVLSSSISNKTTSKPVETTSTRLTLSQTVATSFSEGFASKLSSSRSIFTSSNVVSPSITPTKIAENASNTSTMLIPTETEDVYNYWDELVSCPSSHLVKNYQNPFGDNYTAYCCDNYDTSSSWTSSYEDTSAQYAQLPKDWVIKLTPYVIEWSGGSGIAYGTPIDYENVPNEDITPSNEKGLVPALMKNKQNSIMTLCCEAPLIQDRENFNCCNEARYSISEKRCCPDLSHLENDKCVSSTSSTSTLTSFKSVATSSRTESRAITQISNTPIPTELNDVYNYWDELVSCPSSHLVKNYRNPFGDNYTAYCCDNYDPSSSWTSSYERTSAQYPQLPKHWVVKLTPHAIDWSGGSGIAYGTSVDYKNVPKDIILSYEKGLVPALMINKQNPIMKLCCEAPLIQDRENFNCCSEARYSISEKRCCPDLSHLENDKCVSFIPPTAAITSPTATALPYSTTSTSVVDIAESESISPSDITQTSLESSLVTPNDFNDITKSTNQKSPTPVYGIAGTGAAALAAAAGFFIIKQRSKTSLSSTTVKNTSEISSSNS